MTTDNIHYLPNFRPPEKNEDQPDEIDSVIDTSFDMTRAIINTIQELFPEGETNVKDIAMIEQSVQGIICRMNNIDHPLHDVTDSLFNFFDGDNDNEESD